MDVVKHAFRELVELIPIECQAMPITTWNESVLRHFFCKSLPPTNPGIQLLVECDRIDLVLLNLPHRAYVEFKFYVHRPRFDRVSGKNRGFKGDPSDRNREEFRKCVNILHGRLCDDNLSKYVVLVYADPHDAKPTSPKFSAYYDNYEHSGGEAVLQSIDSWGPVAIGDRIVKARLFRVD